MNVSVVGRFEELIAVAEAKLNRTLKTPTVHFDCRGKKGGYALTQWSTNTHEIHLNPELFTQNKDYYLSDVIPHEVAHIIVHQLYPLAKGHGKEWKQVMKYVFGLEPTRTHDMDVSVVTTKRNMRKFPYKCGCTQHNVSARVHNKIVKGIGYKCNICKQSIAYCEEK
jgi:SprT protein